LVYRATEQFLQYTFQRTEVVKMLS
jgi:hypothetical protein